MFAFAAISSIAQQPFSVKDVMSAPYALGLTASPVGARFAWIENAEGVRNIWVAGAGEAARQVTHYTDDDGQDIGGLAWSPDGMSIAYALGAENGAAGKPANPAELQQNTAVAVWVAALDGRPPVRMGEGRAPLFSPDGRLLFVRGGQIWVADVKGQLDGPPDGKKSNESGAEQLVFDRGAAGGLTLSPDGKWLAYVSRRRRHSFIGLFQMEARALRFVSPSSGNDSAPSFSPDGKQLAWLREPFTEAKEFEANRVSANPWSVQVASLDDLQAKTVYQPEAGKRGSVMPRFATGSPRVWWATNPNSRLIVKNSTSPKDEPLTAGLRRTEFETQKKEGFSDEENNSVPDRSEPWLLFCSEVDGYVHLYGIDPQQPGSKPVPYTEGPYEVEDVSVASGGRMMYFASNRVTDDPLDIDRRHISAEYVEPYYGGVGPVQITSGQGIETRPVVSADGKWVAAVVSSSSFPMRVQFVERQTVWAPSGTLTPKVPVVAVPHQLNLERYPISAMVAPESVVFRSRLVAGAGERSRLARYPILSQSPRKDGPPGSGAGLMIHGQVFLPRGMGGIIPRGLKPRATSGGVRPEPEGSGYLDARGNSNSNSKSKSSSGGGKGTWPAIVFFHGGPRRQMLLGYPAMDYYSNAYAMNQYLASQGYIVLSVNYRCGIGYGLEFRQCEHAGADGASEYNDALAAVEYLRSRGDVDMKRVGIWGGSYGGYFTALGLARNSDLFTAGVDFHGVHDWTREDNAPSDWLKGSNAEVDEIAKRAVASSPIADVAKWRSPVLLIHGDDDPEVAYNQTPLLADALRARGVHVEELVFPDEVHGFLLHKDWVKAYEAEASFFERELMKRTVGEAVR